MIKVISKGYRVDIDLFEKLSNKLGSSDNEIYLIDNHLTEDLMKEEIGNYDLNMLLISPGLIKIEKSNGGLVYVINLDDIYDYDVYSKFMILSVYDIATETNRQNLSIELYLYMCRALLSMGSVISSDDINAIKEILHQEIKTEKDKIYNCLERIISKK